MVTLRRIRQAAAEAQRAEHELRRLVAAAMEQSTADVTAIAAAAGISRSTAYRWQMSAGHTADALPEESWREIMDEAIVALQVADVGPAYVVADALRTADLPAKARRLLHLAGQVPTPLPERERGAVAAGVLVANRILTELKA